MGGAPSALAALAGSLADAYFTQACWGTRNRRPTTSDEARTFLDGVAGGLRPCDSQSGAGVELELSTPSLAGTGLAFEGRLCHLAAFSRRDREDAGCVRVR